MTLQSVLTSSEIELAAVLLRTRGFLSGIRPPSDGAKKTSRKSAGRHVSSHESRAL